MIESNGEKRNGGTEQEDRNYQIPSQGDSMSVKKDNANFWGGFIAGISAGVIIISLIIAFVVLVFVKASFPLPSSVEKNQKTAQPKEVVSNDYEFDFQAIEKKIGKIQNIIAKYYLFEEDASAVEDGIYSGFMRGLGDPYSVYYTADDYNKLTEETTGVYQGIGAMITHNATTGVSTISKVFKGSPSEEAGLEAGDVLYKVDGKDVVGIDLDILVGTYIRGEEGTKVTLTVLRGETSEEIDLEIIRRAIEVPTVEYRMLEDKIGYISVLQFDEITTEQFSSAIKALSDEGMEKMIIDLRDNPGGLLSSVVDMLDFVVPDGLLVYTADKNGEGEKYFAQADVLTDVPMAVLVNGNSASASEVFVGAVKDHKLGTIIGTKTFGKGIVQNLLPLGDGTAIKITTQHYYTPSGFDLHDKGIEPDIKVELEEDAKIGEESDNQLSAAIELLRSREENKNTINE